MRLSIAENTRRQRGAPSGEHLVRDFAWTIDVGRDSVTVDASDGTCAPFLAAADADGVTALLGRLLLAPR